MNAKAVIERIETRPCRRAAYAEGSRMNAEATVERIETSMDSRDCVLLE